MSEEREEHEADEPKNHFLLDELHALIVKLENLHLQISALLATTRMHQEKPSRIAGESPHIADQLKDLIARTAVRPKTPKPVTQLERPITRRTQEASTESPKPHHATGPQANVFSQYLSRRGTDREHHPDMSESMQAKTMEHIKKALRLAKEGDAEGANVNAELAENAIKMAIDFMSEEAYIAFKNEVEARLAVLQSNVQEYASQ